MDTYDSEKATVLGGVGSAGGLTHRPREESSFDDHSALVSTRGLELQVSGIEELRVSGITGGYANFSSSIDSKDGRNSTVGNSR